MDHTQCLDILSDHSDWVMAGSIPIDPLSGQLNNDTVEDEVKQVFDNIEAVLADNDKTLEDIKKFTVFFNRLELYPTSKC